MTDVMGVHNNPLILIPSTQLFFDYVIVANVCLVGARSGTSYAHILDLYFSSLAGGAVY